MGVRAICLQWRFRAYRVKYLHYLSSLLKQTDGKQTVKDIFKKDVNRYGHRHVRGYLSALWLSRLARYGGDLAAAWQGSFSKDTLQVVRVSQRYGARSLTQALTHLAEFHERRDQLKKQIISILWPAFVAIIVLFAVFFLIPFVTVPELQRVFSLVPESYYGKYTSVLYTTAQWLRKYGWLLPFVLLLFVISVWLSLSRFIGPFRKYLEKIEPWRSYRLLAGYRLLYMVHILLSLTHLRLPLKDAVVALMDSTNPWFRSQIVLIHNRMMQGYVGASSFSVGLLDEQDVWFLSDMAQGSDIAQACQKTATHLSKRFEQRLVVLSAVVRWVVLLLGVMTLLGILFWHYQAFEELRMGLMNTYI